MSSGFENLGVRKLMPADFIKLGKERTEAMMTLQKDLRRLQLAVRTLTPEEGCSVSAGPCSTD